MGGCACCRHLGALLWKNGKMKWRFPVSTFFEFALPIIVVALMLAVKEITSRKTIFAQNYASPKFDLATWTGYSPESLTDNNPDVPRFNPISPGSFSRTYDGMHMAILPEILRESGRYLAFVDGGAAAGTVRVFFERWLEKLDPDGKALVFKDTFPSVSAMEGYVTDNDYGFGDRPPIYGAIVVEADGIEDNNFKFDIRLNASQAGGVKNSIFPTTTSNPPMNPLLKGLETEYTYSFLDGRNRLNFEGDTIPLGGFLEFQTVLHAYVLWRKSGADPYISSTAVTEETAAWRNKLFNVAFRQPEGGGDFEKRYEETLRLMTTDEAPSGFVRASWTDTTPTPITLYLRLVNWFNPTTSPYIPMTVREVAFPTTEYVYDEFLEGIGQFFGLFFALVFMWPVSRLLKAIMEEKEFRIKEGMKMMGMTDAALWSSWYVTYVIIFGLCSLFVAATLTAIFERSSFALAFFLFFFFSVGVVSYCLLVSTWFTSAKLAATVGAVIFFILYFPYESTKGATASGGQKVLACLALPTCLAEGINQFTQNEIGSQGLTEDNSSEPINGISFSTVLGLIIFDCIIYFLLAAYLDKVLQGDFGVALPPCFCFTPSFCCPCCCKKRKRRTSVHRAPDQGDTFQAPDPEWEANKRVSLRGLRKEFGGGRKGITCKKIKPFLAVDNSWIDMYEGQILALLGHNGAGKTTTIAMMTGMIPVSSGEAEMYDKSVMTDMAEIRQFIGVCPQHDILFDFLTVREHLYFYSLVKGVKKEGRTEECEMLIDKVGLREKADYRSKGLSGGQKRKLSVAIALLGGSKVVFLDEPSTGMDPFSRRALWDLLKEMKKEKVIVLTTHFMEEADYLGDRIAIMAAGKIKCCGSSLFLKSRYGAGYTFTCSKTKQGLEPKTTAFVKSHVPAAVEISSVAGEIAFKIPFSETAGLPNLIEALEKDGESHGVRSFALSVTTLEEVFLKVGAHEDNDVSKINENEETNQLFRATSKDSLGLPDPLTETQKRRPSEQHEMPDRVPLVETSPPAIDDSHGHAKAHDEGEPVPSGEAEDEEPPVEALPISMDPAGLPNTPDIPPIDVHPSLLYNQEEQPTFAEQGQAVPDEALERRDSNAMERAERLSGKSMFGQHVVAMLIKRFNVAKRDRKGLICQVCLPVVFILLALVLLTANALSFTQYERVTLRTSNGALEYTNPQKFAFACQYNTTCTTVNDKVFTESFNGKNFAPFEAGKLNNGSAVSYTEQMGTWLEEESNRIPSSAYRLGAAYFYSVDLTSTLSTASMDLFWNSTARDSIAVFWNEVFNTFAKAVTERGDLDVTINNYPLPATASEEAFGDLFTAIFLGIGFAFIPAFWGLVVVREREFKSKHLQMISGVSISAYWLSTLLWDMIFYLLPLALVLVLMAAFNVETLLGPETAGATVSLMLLYGVSVAALTYTLQFMFNNHTTAQNLLLMFYILTGSLLLIVSFVLQILPSTSSLHDDVLIYIFYLLPNFALVKGLTNLILIDSSFLWNGDKPGPWEMRVTGYALTYMAAIFVGFFALTIGIEYFYATPALYTFVERCQSGSLGKQEDDGEEDEEAPGGQGLDSDVAAERRRLRDKQDSTDMVRVLGLRKVYPGRPPKVAVRGVWFGIPEGQCFGYLGVNGAGKTTTLKMLTGDVLPSSGTAVLGGRDCLKEQTVVRQLVGYCPQFDALLMELTAREHLDLFARIKGVNADRRASYVQQLIEALGLNEYADRPCGKYSGGNKRKLSVGLSLIGNPAIVFLDEPTSGVDPASRRFMWSLINTTMAGRSVILTTHSMEECEALCSNIGIMVAGQLKCLGSAAHLKAKFGNAFQLEATLREFSRAETNAAAGGNEDESPSKKQARRFNEWVMAKYPGTLLLEAHGTHAVFRIPKTATSLASLFRAIDSAKDDLGIVDYAVSETTLEQIFIHFAAEDGGKME